jgi:hypothetical protein
VGDTANVFGKNYTVKDIRNGEVILMLTPTLDGTWKSEAGTIITFTGGNAVYKQLNPNPSALDKSARDKGFVKIGSQAYRNMKKTGDLTYTGQISGTNWGNNDPNVATGVSFGNVTITLSADGKTFSNNYGGTFTRQ